MPSADIQESIDQARSIAEENLKLLGEMQGALSRCKLNKQMLHALVLERSPRSEWVERDDEGESLTIFLQAHGLNDLKFGGFRVLLAPGVRERLAGLLEKTGVPWLPEESLQSWSEILQLLSSSPREWGETLVSLPEMIVQTRVLRKWLVIFGVHAKKPSVWVHAITPMPDHPVLGVATVAKGSGVAV